MATGIPRSTGLPRFLQRTWLPAQSASRSTLRAGIHVRVIAPRGGLRLPRPAGRTATFHNMSAVEAADKKREIRGHNNEVVPDQAPPTDFEQMDVLGATPVPSTSVDVCMWDGFQLNNGTKILDGKGVLLVGGEAFAWQPWETNGGSGGQRRLRLVNVKGQWEVPPEALGLFSLMWPRPSLLIIGQGPEIRPLSPETKRYISSLGMQVEVLDTRNAASQFNMLATERGVGEVAAALIPIGWREGVGVR